MTAKLLRVSSQLQAALLTELLIAEIQTGFWVTMRPAGHGSAWDGVKVVVSDTDAVGPEGWKPMKNYDFLNPEFIKLNEDRIVQVASSIKPGIKFKALKKELIELARIIGGRMTDKTKEPARLFRGNNRADFDVIRTVDKQKVVTVAGAKAEPAVKKTAVKKTVTKAPTTPVTEAVKKVAAAVKTASAAKKASAKKTAATDDGVEVMTTSSGATVRKVAVKRAPAAT